MSEITQDTVTEKKDDTAKATPATTETAPAAETTTNNSNENNNNVASESTESKKISKSDIKAEESAYARGPESKWLRTRKGDTIGDTPKRQRLLSKNPDSWVCVLYDELKLENREFVSYKQFETTVIFKTTCFQKYFLSALFPTWLIWWIDSHLFQAIFFSVNQHSR
ncbi:unnamed protein product [Ambrosiozyma monospora]|uniref:Unnamed protein product n=1 Tax=Ambrosiozyma monospora TaxID=43982 RepID=A0ACB5TFI8_AMBMO|nr:unnamed protein product [Ambrosiozyma monospora]